MTLGQHTAGKDLKVRYLYLGGFMLLGLLVLAVRLYRLQVTRGDELAAKSVENFVKEVRIPADRGQILDVTGRILVDSRPSFDVFITPAFCMECEEEVIPRLAAWLGWGGEEREEVAAVYRKGRRSAPFRPVAIRIDVPRDTADLLDAHRLELPGVDVQATPHRDYRTGPVLSHVLGYMNEITQSEYERLNAKGAHYQLGDYIGRQGLEKAFEPFLRGEDGNRKRVVDARGQPIPGLSDLVGGGDVVEPVPGHNVVLSIDMRLQEEADRAFPGQAGAVIALDVRTGFILTLLSRPGYDPNLLTGRISSEQMSELARDPFKPLMNRVTAMHYSPGSTFKVVTALAALREEVVTPQTEIFCPGGYRLGRRTWRCWREAGHGHMNATEALQHSCDTYYYRMADLMGIDPIAREGRELGLGAPTGIEVLPEEPGIMPDEAYHDRVSPGGYVGGFALNTAIGQGDVNVTPLQLAMVYATIANGGSYWRPQLVRRIETANGRLVKRFEPELLRKVDMLPEDRAVVVNALDMVVNVRGGTAYWRRLKDVRVAGKTGTAQVARLGEERLKTEEMDYWVRDHAWFAAFAPVEDPEIAVVVLNEHGGHGGSDAAPTAMALIKKYFELKKEDAARAIAAIKEVPAENAPRPILPDVSAAPAPAAAVPAAAVVPSAPEQAAPAPEQVPPPQAPLPVPAPQVPPAVREPPAGADGAPGHAPGRRPDVPDEAGPAPVQARQPTAGAVSGTSAPAPTKPPAARAAGAGSAPGSGPAALPDGAAPPPKREPVAPLGTVAPATSKPPATPAPAPEREPAASGPAKPPPAPATGAPAPKREPAAVEQTKPPSEPASGAPAPKKQPATPAAGLAPAPKQAPAATGAGAAPAPAKQPAAGASAPKGPSAAPDSAGAGSARKGQAPSTEGAPAAPKKPRRPAARPDAGVRAPAPTGEAP